MILAWYATLPTWLKIAIPVSLIIAVMLLVASLMPGDETAQRQAEQTTRSSEAITQAAQEAIETIGQNTATEETITAASRQAAQEIDNAQNAAAIRAAVLETICRRPTHSGDPACRPNDARGL